MAKRLGAYRASVRAALGHPPQDMISDQEVDDAINESYYEIARLFAHRRLKRDTTITTVDGTQEYALPSDYFWMRYVRDGTNAKTLVHKNLEFIQETYGTDTGQPEHWETEDQNLMLGATPDGTYTLREWYMARPARLTATVQKDVLDEEWEEILKRGAIYRGFYTVGEYDRQIHTFNMWKRLIGDITETQGLERNTGVDIAGPMTAEGKPTH